jgi:hypothetical protein
LIIHFSFSLRCFSSLEGQMKREKREGGGGRGEKGEGRRERVV